jgi:hypothetical protein
MPMSHDNDCFFLIVINVVFKWLSVLLMLLRYIFLITGISLSKKGQLEFVQILGYHFLPESEAKLLNT